VAATRAAAACARALATVACAARRALACRAVRVKKAAEARRQTSRAARAATADPVPHATAATTAALAPARPCAWTRRAAALLSMRAVMAPAFSAMATAWSLDRPVAGQTVEPEGRAAAAAARAARVGQGAVG